MTVYIDSGWAWISNSVDYLKVFVETIYWTEIYAPEIEHKQGGLNFGFDLSLYYIVVKLMGVWVESVTEKNDFSSYIKSWQQANTLQIEVVRNNSNDKEKLDGTNTILPCLVVGGLKEFEKMRGEQQKYRCQSITLEQNGTMS